MHSLVVGHFGGKNTGDEAMLSGLLQLFRQNDTATIITKDRSSLDWIEPRHSIIEASPLSRFSIVRKGQFDTFIFCGGTHFHDNYRLVRLLRHWAYLVVQILLVYQAKRKGCRVLVLGNGFGPLRYRFTRKLTRIFCGFADHITVRDYESDDLLNELKVQHSVHADLAFLNSENGFEASQKTLLGISVTNEPGYSNHIPDHEYIYRIEKVVNAICSSDVIERIHIIVIRGGHVESDFPLSQKLAARLNDIGVETHIIEHDDNPAKMIAAIGKCSFFLGARFHSIVLSLLTEVRHIGIIPYHRKLTSLANDFGLSGNVLNIYEESFQLSGADVVNLKVHDSELQALKNAVTQTAELLKGILYDE